MADESRMVMAGLWDEWTDNKTGERVKSCTIIICPANAFIGTLHDRMPVILAEDDWAKWLGEETAMNDELKALLVPFMDEALTLWPVNRQKTNRQRPQQGSRSGVARDVALTWRGLERIRCS